MHHSDRGSQYASHAFQGKLKEYGMVCSMSRKGNCWDTQFILALNALPNLTHAGIGKIAFALTCRLGQSVPRSLPGPMLVT